MKKKWLLWGCAAAVIVIIVCIAVFAGGEAELNARPSAVPGNARESGYQSYLSAHGYDGALSDAQIAVDVFRYETSGGMIAENGVEGVLTGDTGVITWPFETAKSGFYHVEIGYIALPGTTSDIQRRVLIDGEAPYAAMNQIVFKRLWRDESIRLKNENEIRPNAEEVYREQTVYLEDYDRRSGAPLIVYLKEGAHILSFEVVKEPMEITSIAFNQAPTAPAYIDALEKWTRDGEMYVGDALVYQAERRGDGTVDIVKSSPAITVQKNYADASLTPYHPWHILYNTIGADKWSQPGDAVTWTIDAPESGLYALTFRGRQTSRGVTSYRRLLVNGEIPFAEAAAIGFDYSGVMQNYTVADRDGEPYYFYLNKGENSVTLEAVLGGVGGVLSEVEESLRNLNALYLRVIQMTGQAPSRFIDYEIARKIPEFVPTMREESDRLLRLVDEMMRITGEKGENTALLEKMALEALELSRRPEKVVDELAQLKNNISALGTWMVKVSTMPLELDCLMLSADADSLPAPRESFLAGLWADTQRFVSTFFVKTSGVIAEDGAPSEAVTVWMASSGREQAQIIQNMIDETFTPETGIAVKLQLIPVDVVLRAALAGNGPDVVIGLSQATAQDFAMRGAVVDLSKLSGFEEATARYSDGVMRTASYQGGVWGIPERVNFMMLFYRQDALDELHESVPTTWDEVMELIPVLKRANYDFYMPSTRVTWESANLGVSAFMSMVKQNGGSVYKGEGDDFGIESALESDEAMTAFKWYTDLFTVHGLEVQVDFPNRFRTGEMSLGITDYTTYCQLEIFAPEIKGLWSFSAYPGAKNADGSLDNAYVCETIQSVIMNGADDKDKAWAFVKWWNSTDNQLSYANTLESIMGAAARYAAADPEVIKRLPWSNKELTQLLNQYESLDGMPAVPGYYMNTRMIQYAFEDVVADLSNPRETLYMNIREINKELTKKREEFGLSTRGEGTGL